MATFGNILMRSLINLVPCENTQRDWNSHSLVVSLADIKCQFWQLLSKPQALINHANSSSTLVIHSHTLTNLITCYSLTHLLICYSLVHSLIHPLVTHSPDQTSYWTAWWQSQLPSTVHTPQGTLRTGAAAHMARLPGSRPAARDTDGTTLSLNSPQCMLRLGKRPWTREARAPPLCLGAGWSSMQRRQLEERRDWLLWENNQWYNTHSVCHVNGRSKQLAGGREREGGREGGREERKRREIDREKKRDRERDC